MGPMLSVLLATRYHCILLCRAQSCKTENDFSSELAGGQLGDGHEAEDHRHLTVHHGRAA